MLALTLTATALAAFPQDAPDDPGYRGNPVQCVDSMQYEALSTIPACTQAPPAATDPEGAAGMSIDRAWRDFTTGDPETVIAYVDLRAVA